MSASRVDRVGVEGPPTSTLTMPERAAMVLQGELAGDALANITRSNRVWEDREHQLLGSHLGRRVRDEIQALLELFTEPLAAPARRAIPSRNGVRAESRPAPEPVAVLRPARPVEPGARAQIRTALRNGRTQPVALGFWCSELVAEPHARIAPARIHVEPRWISILPSGLGHIAVEIEVPDDARPGVYRGLFHVVGIPDLWAILTLDVAGRKDL